MFYERLDILMKITDTGNSSLGRGISFDPSYISKMRRGVRNPPKNSEFLDSVCSFFERKITEKKKEKVVSDIILKGMPLPSERKERITLIRSWLLDEDEDREYITDIISSVSGYASDAPSFAVTGRKNDTETGNVVSFYYGNEGKREAVLKFLEKISEEPGKVRKILLFSNENMEWMYESAPFMKKWSAALKEVTSKGIKIKIIHSIQRDLNEMTVAIKKWMPLYLTGLIEPYYCPRIRDQIYRRTIFVAPGHSAITSTSIADDTEEMVNMLFYDKKAIKAFEKEFNNYLSVCRPLMNVYREDLDKVFAKSLMDLLSGEESICIAGSHPLFLLIPDEYFRDAPKRVRETLFDLKEAFFRALENNVTITEVFPLTYFTEDREDLKAFIYPGTSGEYSTEVRKAHLERILDLMRRYENYRPVISSVPMDHIEMISKEDGKTMIYTPFNVFFEIKEQNMSSALFDYVGRIPGDKDRKEVQQRITAIIRNGGGT